MTGADPDHEIVKVQAEPGNGLVLHWLGAPPARLDLSDTVRRAPFRSLSDPQVFSQVQVGDWGHSLVWPDDVEIGADSLWLDSLSAWGRDDTRAFLEWRLRNGFSLSAAAEALGLARRTVAYYASGRPVPRTVLLACKGWDAQRAA